MSFPRTAADEATAPSFTATSRIFVAGVVPAAYPNGDRKVGVSDRRPLPRE